MGGVHEQVGVGDGEGASGGGALLEGFDGGPGGGGVGGEVEGLARRDARAPERGSGQWHSTMARLKPVSAAMRAADS
ncbi:MAG: hypothetical protein U0232_28955 [Thermomicrobiales bacterium]